MILTVVRSAPGHASWAITSQTDCADDNPGATSWVGDDRVPLARRWTHMLAYNPAAEGRPTAENKKRHALRDVPDDVGDAGIEPATPSV